MIAYSKLAHHTCVSATLLILLAGCSGGNDSSEVSGKHNVNMIADFGISESLIQAHIKANGLEESGVRYERSIQSFVENNALAYAIATRSEELSPNLAYRVASNRNTSLIKTYLNEHVEQVISNDVVQKYYEDNIERFTVRRVKGAHILLSFSGLNPQQREEKLNLAKELAKQARSGDAFAQLVKEYSDDKESIEKAGEMTVMSSEDFSSGPLFDTLVHMEKGDVSEPVETHAGIHVLTLIEEPEIEVSPLAQVKEKIAYQLKYEERTAEIKRLREFVKNKVNDDLRLLGISKVDNPSL